MRLRVGFKAIELPLTEAVERHQGDHAGIVAAGRKRGHDQAHMHLLAQFPVRRAQHGVRGHAAAQAERGRTGFAQRHLGLLHLHVHHGGLEAGADVRHVELTARGALVVDVGDHGSLQTRKAEAHVARVHHGARELDGLRVALGALRRHHGAARVAQAERLGHLVERLAHRIVDGGAQHAVIAPAAHMHEHGVSAADQGNHPVVPRYNGQRSQRAQCSPAPGIETEKARLAIAEQIENIPLPEGYSLVWQGEKIASDQSMKYLFQNFPLAIILMIAILIMLFKDYRKPIIIFCCIPMIFVGVVVVMLLTGKVFNFVAIVGTLGLIGMLIKNGIVLMDEITLQINEGVEPITALIDSSQSRLRPVMMASLTTILGMIPLLSDAMFGSLAAAIMGGLLCSTLITLLFIPILYALFFKIKNN